MKPFRCGVFPRAFAVAGLLGWMLVPGAATLPAAEAPAAASPAPNILFILADDFGLDGVGCYGSDRFQGRTPHLDQLAASGIRFTHAYAMPLCGPSRCTLLTGRYGFRTGGSTNDSAGRPSSREEPSVARALKEAGYITGMAGKWRQVGGTPGDWGFDEWLTDRTAGGWYWKNSYIKNGQQVTTPQEVYHPDVCMEFARDFLKRHAAKPFFLYFPMHLIHGPILRTPDSQEGAAKSLYADNVAYLDKQVGLLVAALDELSLREKTLVLFTGDNGTAKFGAAQSFLQGRRINGMKGSLLEGGSRVPLLASWKGVAPEGKVVDDLVDFSDFFATFTDLAGTKPPPGATLDSRSFAPQLRGEAGQPREWVFVQLGTRWYVRERGFKLTRAGELFDMIDAPFAEKLVAAGTETETEAAKAARARLQGVLDQLSPATGKIPPPGTKKARGGKKHRKLRRLPTTNI